MEYAGYLLLLLILITGILFRRSKAVTLLILLYMWVMIALNTESPDYLNYKMIYDNCLTLKSSFEPIYMYLCIICKFLSFSYLQFRMVIATIIVLFIFLAMRKHEKRDNYLLILFLLFPFTGFISGLRAAVSMAISSYAFYFLLLKEKKALWKYICLILIASGFQFFALFYLLFAISPKVNKKIIFVLLGTTPMVTIAYRNGWLLKIMNYITDDYRILHWFDNSETKSMRTLVVLIIVLLQLGFVVGSHYAIKRIKRRTFDAKSGFGNDFSLERWEKANYITLAIIPMYFITTVFTRFFHGMVFLNLLIMLKSFEKEERIERKWTPMKKDAGTIRISNKLYLDRVYVAILMASSFIWFECILEADYFMVKMFCNNLIFSM